MTAKKILLLCDTSDIGIIEESFAHCPEYEIRLETIEKILETGVQEYLHSTIDHIRDHPGIFDAVAGTHDSSAVFASIIAEQTGKVNTPINSIIACQNKYISRLHQKESAPENTPAFFLASDYFKQAAKFQTAWAKPVRSNMTHCNRKITAVEELEELIGNHTTEVSAYNQYYLDALAVVDHETSELNIETCNRFLVEELLHGTQFTVDGYVHEGEVHTFGVTKAVFYPGTNSFHHHEFPYETSAGVGEKIEKVVHKLIPDLGLNNTFFNVEFRAEEETGSVHILEVNSRIAFQFAKAIEAVRGVDPLHWLCEVAIGEDPRMRPTRDKRFNYCYNFELRHFEDKWVARTPLQANYEEIRWFYPEVHIRNMVGENTRLSDYKHTLESYRYCTLDIPGDTREEIMQKRDHIEQMLGYEFHECPDEPETAHLHHEKGALARWDEPAGTY